MGAVLVFAPQPFFQERGTPIAVRLLVEELADAGYTVDLLTFHEGEPFAYAFYETAVAGEFEAIYGDYTLFGNPRKITGPDKLVTTLMYDYQGNVLSTRRQIGRASCRERV